jgi:hypothetical protein
LWC